MHLKEVHFIDRNTDMIDIMRTSFNDPKPFIWKRCDNIWEIFIPKQLVVHLVPGNVMNAPASVLVASEGIKFKGDRHVAEQLLKCDDDEYKRERRIVSARSHSYGDVEVTRAPKGLKFTKVFHVILPSWRTGTVGDINDYRKGIGEAMQRADKEFSSLAFPFVGGGKEFF